MATVADIPSALTVFRCDSSPADPIPNPNMVELESLCAVAQLILDDIAAHPLKGKRRVSSSSVMSDDELALSLLADDASDLLARVQAELDAQSRKGLAPDSNDDDDEELQNSEIEVAKLRERLRKELETILNKALGPPPPTMASAGAGPSGESLQAKAELAAGGCMVNRALLPSLREHDVLREESCALDARQSDRNANVALGSDEAYGSLPGSPCASATESTGETLFLDARSIDLESGPADASVASPALGFLRPAEDRGLARDSTLNLDELMIPNGSPSSSEITSSILSTSPLPLLLPLSPSPPNQEDEFIPISQVDGSLLPHEVEREGADAVQEANHHTATGASDHGADTARTGQHDEEPGNVNGAQDDEDFARALATEEEETYAALLRDHMYAQSLDQNDAQMAVPNADGVLQTVRDRLLVDRRGVLLSQELDRAFVGVRRHLIIVDDTDEGVLPNDEGVNNATLVCTRCMDPIRGPRVIVGCGHAYDLDCIVELYTAVTTDESLYPPQCCAQRFPDDEVMSLLLPDLAQLYERKQLEYETPSRVYCYACGTFVGASARTPDVLLCPDDGCEEQTCARCSKKAHAWHEPCADAADDEELRQIQMLGKASEWQRCPKCGWLVERTDGCLHMTCRCRQEFCYRCDAKHKTCEC